MAGSAEREALKQRAVRALEDSRRLLTDELSRASVFLHPRRLIEDNVRKHRVAYLIGGALAGLVTLRLLFAPRAAASSSSGSSFKGRLMGLLGTAMWPMLKGPAMAFAGRYLNAYLHQIFPSSQPPEATVTE